MHRYIASSSPSTPPWARATCRYPRSWTTSSSSCSTCLPGRLHEGCHGRVCLALHARPRSTAWCSRCRMIMGSMSWSRCRRSPRRPSLRPRIEGRRVGGRQPSWRSRGGSSLLQRQRGLPPSGSRGGARIASTRRGGGAREGGRPCWGTATPDHGAPGRWCLWGAHRSEEDGASGRWFWRGRWPGGGGTKEKLGIDLAIEDGLCAYGGRAALVSGRACACVVCFLWSLNPEHRRVVVKLPLRTRDRSNQTISADRQPFASLAPLCQNPYCLHPLPWSASLPFELCTRNLHMILVLHVLMLYILFRFDKEWKMELTWFTVQI
jgi:hypothetical protein